MGEGLKRVAKECGGITVLSRCGGQIILQNYDKNGKKIKFKPPDVIYIEQSSYKTMGDWTTIEPKVPFCQYVPKGSERKKVLKEIKELVDSFYYGATSHCRVSLASMLHNKLKDIS